MSPAKKPMMIVQMIPTIADYCETDVVGTYQVCRPRALTQRYGRQTCVLQ